MPTEQVLPLALSGSEIKKAILDKIAIALNRNCHLNDNLAYGDGFSFEIQIKVHAQDLGRKVDETIPVEGAYKTEMQGDKQVMISADPEEYRALDAAEANIEMNSVDPTATRIETNQPVPVRVTDRDGKDSIKEVKYGMRR